ncbi:MAG: hypothetical protein PHP64_04265 [Actinomycetota bacterium]|nr:hypothetical protein [Actinomycetota bacterium]
MDSSLTRALENRDMNFLREAFSSAQAGKKIEIIHAMAESGGRDSVGLLIQIASARYEEKPEVRIAALKALSKVQPKDEYSNTLGKFILNENRRVMFAARRILRDVESEGWARRLADLGALDYSAISVYGREKEKSAVPLLIDFIAGRLESKEIYNSQWWGKVYAALLALGRIGGDDAKNALFSVIDFLEKLDRTSCESLERMRIEKIEEAAKIGIKNIRNE